MVSLLVLMLVAIIITQSTEVVKGFYNWGKETVLYVKEKRFSEIKIGVPVSIAFGLWAGFTIGTNIFVAIFEIGGIQYELNANFITFSIFTTSLLLSLGSGGIINVVEKYRNGKQALEELAKQNKD